MASSPILQDLHGEFLRSVNDAIDHMTLGAHDAPAAANKPIRNRYRRIVVAYDGSEGAKLALAWAKEIAGLHGSEILVATAYSAPRISGVTVGNGWYPRYAEIYAEDQKRARQIADATAADLTTVDLKASAHALEGSPGRVIAKLAQDRQADLIVTGAARHSRLARLVLGSTAIGLVENASTNVLVARDSPPISRILVATDGSSLSYRAVADALGLASDMNAELIVEHVLELPEAIDEGRAEAWLRRVLDDVELPSAPPRVRYSLEAGDPASRILTRASTEEVGLVVVGAHGRGAVERALVGSVSRRVANLTRSSALVVKETRA
ncbi:MAG: universal stress protein [Thermoplasmatota archaeon]